MTAANTEPGKETSAVKTVLSLRDICKSYGETTVLKDISCDFFAGEVHCLMGENGAGKSTLMKIVSGAIQADSGTVEIDGTILAKPSPLRARNMGIATIYQELDLIPTLDGAENMFLGQAPIRFPGRIDKAEQKRLAQQVLDRMHISVDLDRPVQELGIAQQQMIAIAKSLIHDCRVLILDEPTAVFTRVETEALFDLIRKLCARGIAVVFISHHMEEIFEIGNRISILRDGAVVSTGSIGEYSHDRLVNEMVGREFIRHERQKQAQQGNPLPAALRVENLTDGVNVHDVSLSIERGEILGVAGLVGSGRTELARLIYAADRRTGGEIYLNDQRVDPKSPFEAVRCGIGMVSEDRKRDGLVLMRSVLENAAYTLARKSARNGYVPWRRVHQRAREVISRLVVRPNRPGLAAGRLSGGNQQKVVLARWLAADVSVLILDEPTRGVDIGARAEIYATIEDIARSGVAILIISSDLPEVLSMSDRILVMGKGKLRGELNGATATEEAIMALAFGTRPAEVAA